MSAIFGEILTFGQQTGEDVELKVFGDEHYARYEDLNGYTAVYDSERGQYCYARLSNAVFVSTGVPITQDPPHGLPRHLQEARETVSAKAQARRYRRAARSAGRVQDRVVRTFGPNQGLLEGRVLSTGTVKGLTILVDFQDVSSSVTSDDVADMLNGDNYAKNGNICSVHEYFKRVSSGKLDYSNVVVGPYTLSRNREFYVDNLLVQEALDLAIADGLDLTRFDSRREGIVDALSIMYAGQTQYRGDLWPHNSTLTLNYGEIRTNLYLLTSLGRSAADLSIGTFCHESGHLLCRFPDMYDYAQRDGDNVDSAGIGYFCLMGAGNHLDFGRSPSPVCAYLRDLAGWCDTEVDLSVAGGYTAGHGDYDTVMKYRTSKPNEYFLVEDRSKMGLDRGSPASGLAVYHCDILGSNELQEGTATRHYQCALLQADGHRDLELNVNQGDETDLFGMRKGMALSSDSSPHTREWDGRDSGLVISDISPQGTQVSFTVGASATPTRTMSVEAAPNLEIPDDRLEGISSAVTVPEGGILQRLNVEVDIKHPRRGDLLITLTAPTGRRAVLHSRLGEDDADLVAAYDSASPGTLTSLVGQPVGGTWTLTVVDQLHRKIGRLNAWRLRLHTAPLL
jgi:M6 family metalloprotease-like protein